MCSAGVAYTHLKEPTSFHSLWREDRHEDMLTEPPESAPSIAWMAHPVTLDDGEKAGLDQILLWEIGNGIRD